MTGLILFFESEMRGSGCTPINRDIVHLPCVLVSLLVRFADSADFFLVRVSYKHNVMVCLRYTPYTAAVAHNNTTVMGLALGLHAKVSNVHSRRIWILA